jgi:hypothetical protein
MKARQTHAPAGSQALPPRPATDEKIANSSSDLGPPGEPARDEKTPELFIGQPPQGNAAADVLKGQAAATAPAAGEPAAHAGPPRGRPTVLDAVTKAKIIGVITAGLSQHIAADYVGISQSTISKALRRDPEFALEMDKAVATSQLLPLSKIIRASERSWRAAVWLYQHARPETTLTRRRARLRRQREEKRARARAAEEARLKHAARMESAQRTAAEVNELQNRLWQGKAQADEAFRKQKMAELDQLRAKEIAAIESLGRRGTAAAAASRPATAPANAAGDTPIPPSGKKA